MRAEVRLPELASQGSNNFKVESDFNISRSYGACVHAACVLALKAFHSICNFEPWCLLTTLVAACV